MPMRSAQHLSIEYASTSGTIPWMVRITRFETSA